MQTRTITPKEITRKWLLVDAEGLVLGRAAAEVARLLRGKHKAYYSPNLDCGDNVVVINAKKVKLTGKKATGKPFYWHTGYPGGLKEITKKERLEGKHPERLFIKAVERMLPRAPMGWQQMSKLHVYADATHPHEAQKLEAYDIAAKNPKNKR